MIDNPKNSILKINAVQCVYVESGYKIFMSTYKKLNNNDDISNVSDLPFDEMCLFPELTKSMTQRQKNRQSICYSKQFEKNMVQMF